MAVHTQPRMGMVTRFDAAKPLLDKALDEAVERKNLIPLEGARLFRTVNTETLEFKGDTVGNALRQPRIQEDSDDLPYSSPVRGFDYTGEVDMYRLAIAVTKTAVGAQRAALQKIPFMLGGLMGSMLRNMEYNMADIPNNAFTGTAGADVKALCADDHPNEDAATGTWDNLGDAADLSHAAYSLARIALHQRESELGEVAPMASDLLVISTGDEETARQIMNTDRVEDSSLWGVNWNLGNADIMVYHYKTDEDSWFVFDTKNADENGLIFIEHEAPNINDNPSPKADIVQDMYIRAMYKTIFSTCKNIQGNPGL